MPNSIMVVIVLLLSAYTVIKFSVFFLVPYAKRREGLDKTYAGRSYGSAKADVALLVICVLLSGALLATGVEPISFLGGLFVGATLIQMFFHAYHVDPPVDRQAPEPRSPLRRLSYAIQDQPGRAAPVMLIYSLIIIAAVAIYYAK